MPKAQPQTECPKVNPFITKTISKSLLTPCRQVGLSRKKKTPNSANDSFSESTKIIVDTTPVSSFQPLNATRDASEPKINTQETQNVTFKKKTKVSKRLISDDESEGESSKTHQPNKKPCKKLQDVDSGIIADKTASEECKINATSSSNKVTKSQTKSKKSPRKSKKKSSEAGIKEDMNSGSKEDDKNDTNNKFANEKCFDVGNKNISVAEEPKIHNKNDLNRKTKITSQITKSEINSQQKKEYKTISGKTEKLAQNSDQTLQEMKGENIVILSDLTNTEATLKATESSKNTQVDKTKKIKRCLSMKRSSSDDKNHEFEDVILKECLIHLNSVDGKTASASRDLKSLPDEIKILQKQIKEKNRLLDELKQAEVYQKKHNVKELEELTARWKKGCISALNDLLPQLQRHASMDMTTLLNNLGVPKEKITISPSGDLI